MRTFIIGTQRSGTTVLRSLLESLGALNCGEVFHSTSGVPYRFRDWLNGRPSTTDFFRLYLEELEMRHGFLALDVKYNFLIKDYQQMLQVILEEPSVIQVIRRNKLEILTSHFIAKKIDVWGVQGESPVDVKVCLPVEDVIAHLKYLESEDEFVSRLLPNATRIFYEEMFAGDVFSDSLLEPIGRHCPQPVEALPAPAWSKMTRPLRDAVENYEEIEALLEGTEFNWMLS